MNQARGIIPHRILKKTIFKERSLSYVGQMKLQKYMMEELLGIKTDFMFLVYKKEKSGTHKVVSWAEAFGTIDMNLLSKWQITSQRHNKALHLTAIPLALHSGR